MKNIKFSHQYTKMPEGWNKPHLLLEVFKVNYKDLSEVFIDYDTEILYNLSHYPLPKTDLLVLLLMCSDNGRIWTTIRRWTPRKEEYYKGLRGQEVGVIIEEKPL